MQAPQDAVLLRAYFGEDERHGAIPVHQAIVLKAREMQLAGATVLRGPIGYGHSSHIHTTKILRLSKADTRFAKKAPIRMIATCFRGIRRHRWPRPAPETARDERG